MKRDIIVFSAGATLGLMTGIIICKSKLQLELCSDKFLLRAETN